MSREQFVMVPRWLLDDLSEKRIVPAAVGTFVAIAQYGKGNTGKGIFVSQETLSEVTRQEERTLRRHIKQLVEVGAITHQKRYVKGRRTSDLYTVAVAARLTDYRTYGPGSDADPNGASCPVYGGHEAPSNQTHMNQTAAAVPEVPDQQQQESEQEDAKAKNSPAQTAELSSNRRLPWPDEAPPRRGSLSDLIGTNYMDDLDTSPPWGRSSNTKGWTA